MGFGVPAFPGIGGEAVGVVAHRCPLRDLDERRVPRFFGALLVAVLQHGMLLLWLAGLGDFELSPSPPLVVSLDAIGLGSPGSGPGGAAGKIREGPSSGEPPITAALASPEPSATTPETIEVPAPPEPEVVALPEPPVIQPKPAKPKTAPSKTRPATTTSAKERGSSEAGSVGKPGNAAGDGAGTDAGTGRGSGTGAGTGGGGTAAVESAYRAHLVAWLARHKRYPARARAMGLEGQVVVRVTLARDGRVQSHEIEEDSAYSVLLHEVEAMVDRANPFPAMPATLAGERFELRVPVDFRLRDAPRSRGS